MGWDEDEDEGKGNLEGWDLRNFEIFNMCLVVEEGDFGKRSLVELFENMS